MQSKFSSLALSVLLVISAGVAPATAQESSAVTSENYVELFEFGDEYSHDPHNRRAQLKHDGFQKTSEKVQYGRVVETYKKVSPEGLSIEYDVLGDPVIASPASFVRFEWDWGPRIYMTGEEFWSLGASGFAGTACGFLGKSVKLGTACSVAATAAWNKLTAKRNWAHDDQCYDLSQFMNIGWEKAPREKCD
ncbi:hypothetical protein ACUY3J_09030 [Corynebacterium segmentosum]